MKESDSENSCSEFLRRTTKVDTERHKSLLRFRVMGHHNDLVGHLVQLTLCYITLGIKKVTLSDKTNGLIE